MCGKVCIFHHFSSNLYYLRLNSTTDVFKQGCSSQSNPYLRPSRLTEENACVYWFPGPEAWPSTVSSLPSLVCLFSSPCEVGCWDMLASGCRCARHSGLAGSSGAPHRPLYCEATTHRRQNDKSSAWPNPLVSCRARDAENTRSPSIPARCASRGTWWSPVSSLGFSLGDNILLCSSWAVSVAGCLAQCSYK